MPIGPSKGSLLDCLLYSIELVLPGPSIKPSRPGPGPMNPGPLQTRSSGPGPDPNPGFINSYCLLSLLFICYAFCLFSLLLIFPIGSRILFCVVQLFFGCFSLPTARHREPRASRFPQWISPPKVMPPHHKGLIFSMVLVIRI